MRLLVLGGTSWVGGRVAEQALAAGHQVTCLARGLSGAVPAGADLVTADRWLNGAYDGLVGEFDAAVEVSWQPGHVHTAAMALAGRVSHWVYVSSISGYADLPGPRGHERDPLLPLLPAPWDVASPPDSYGSAKVTCEAILDEVVGRDRLLVARAGLIAGYGDRSDRFGYWPGRFAQADERPRVLAAPVRTPVQVIDVEDLARWLVRCAAERVSAIVDAVGARTTLGEVLDLCAGTLPSGVRPVVNEVDEEWLVKREVAPWAGPRSLPLWLPRSAWAMATRTGRAALATGLRPRPLARTVTAAARWEHEQGLRRERRAGLTAGEERELLDRL